MSEKIKIVKRKNRIINVPYRGLAGATFIPSVSEDGVISWTNNAGLENPPPVDIRGPRVSSYAELTDTPDLSRYLTDEDLRPILSALRGEE